MFRVLLYGSSCTSLLLLLFSTNSVTAVAHLAQVISICKAVYVPIIECAREQCTVPCFETTDRPPCSSTALRLET
jgi:hypothetical protein